MKKYLTLAYAKRLFLNLGLLMGLLIAAELFQSRSLKSGELPRELVNMPIMTLSGKAQNILFGVDSVVLIYAFAPWCKVCSLSVGTLNAISEDYEVRPLGLSYGSVEELRQFRSSEGLNLPVYYDNRTDYGEMLGIEAFPSYFIVNKEGEILYTWVGLSSEFGLRFKLIISRLLG